MYIFILNYFPETWKILSKSDLVKISVKVILSIVIFVWDYFSPQYLQFATCIIQYFTQDLQSFVFYFILTEVQLSQV